MRRQQIECHLNLIFYTSNLTEGVHFAKTFRSARAYHNINGLGSYQYQG